MPDLDISAKSNDAATIIKKGYSLPDAVIFDNEKGLFFEGKGIRSDRFYITLLPNTWMLFKRHKTNKDCFVASAITSSPDIEIPRFANCSVVYWKREAAYSFVQQDLERLKTKWRDLL